jgi:thiamine transport system permease protein
MVTHSSRRITSSLFVSAFFLLFLVSPYLILFSHYGFEQTFDYSEIRWAINNSIFQGILSAIIATLVSIVLMFGLIRLSKFRSTVEYLILLPSFLPPLFVILAFLEVLDPFPVGNLGVSLIVGFTYSGLIAVQLSNWLVSNAGGLVETATVLGASRSMITIEVFKILKTKLFYNFLLVFCLAFTSFSVPLVVGGGRGTNLEILIYEKIRISNNWKEAITLALFQSIFLLGFSTIQSQIVMRKSGFVSLRKISSRFGLVFCFLYFGIFSAPFLLNLNSGYQQASQINGLIESANNLLAPTLMLSIGGGIVAALVLSGLVFVSDSKFMQKILSGLVSPSTAIVGFASILVSPFFTNPYFLYIYGFILIVLSSIYRLGLINNFQTLSDQIGVAKVMGASHGMIWRNITLPQLMPTILKLSGIVAFWIVGDFALSKIVFTSDVTLAMLVQGLMESYRIDSAMFFATGVLAMGAGIYFLFWGMSYVISRRT